MEYAGIEIASYSIASLQVPLLLCPPSQKITLESLRLATVKCGSWENMTFFHTLHRKVATLFARSISSGFLEPRDYRMI